LTRIGTPLKQLADRAGGITDETAKVIVGGPMMGKAIADLDIPVTKGTSGLIDIVRQFAYRKTSHTCIRCGKCLTACPMGLEPYLFMTLNTIKPMG
jgi:electron transport complex protein RnfC